MVMRMGRGLAPQITFTLDFHQLLTGELGPGARCAVRYDPLRIVPPGDPYLHGDPSRPVTGYARFRTGGEVTDFALHSPMGVVADPDVDITGQGSALVGMFDVPDDAEEVELWFSFVDAWGQTRWDSAHGSNYHFRFSHDDIEVLQADVTSDPQTPYSGFSVEVSAIPAVTSVTVRYRVVNDPANSHVRLEVPLSRTGEDDAGRVLWAVGGVAVPYRAVITFDVVYVVGGRTFKVDNEGRYFLAPRPGTVLKMVDPPGPPKALLKALAATVPAPAVLPGLELREPGAHPPPAPAGEVASG